MFVSKAVQLIEVLKLAKLYKTSTHKYDINIHWRKKGKGKSAGFSQALFPSGGEKNHNIWCINKCSVEVGSKTFQPMIFTLNSLCDLMN